MIIRLGHAVGCIALTGMVAALCFTSIDTKPVDRVEDKLQEYKRSVAMLKDQIIDMQATRIETLTYELNEVNSTVEELSALLNDNELNTGNFTVTAYSPYDDKNGLNSDGNPNITATGTKPGPGTFAVDPKVVPYGSTVIILYTDGTVERGVAEDTGGMIKGNRLDVFRDTFYNAIEFGRKEAIVLWYTTG